MKILVLASLLILTACFKDETVSGYTDTQTIWQLIEIGGTPTDTRITLKFPEEGRLAGQGPCNRYFGTQTVPYPWFKASAIGSTKMACPDLVAESEYFAALQAMTLIEVSGDSLLLTNETGGSLFFEAQESIK